jgi:hypothetical protein
VVAVETTVELRKAANLVPGASVGVNPELRQYVFFVEGDDEPFLVLYYEDVRRWALIGSVVLRANLLREVRRAAESNGKEITE